jgi:hypothetical protein
LTVSRLDYTDADPVTLSFASAQPIHSFDKYRQRQAELILIKLPRERRSRGT